MLIFSPSLTNLSAFYTPSLLEYNSNKQCIYLKYWFYDKIINNEFTNQDLQNIFYEIFEKREITSRKTEFQYLENTEDLRLSKKDKIKKEMQEKMKKEKKEKIMTVIEYH